MTTTIEVVTAADGAQAFGGQARLLLGQTPLVLRWDSSRGAYVPPQGSGGPLAELRIARLRDDVHLFQVQLDGEEQFYLVPFRISPAKQITPLGCEVPQAVAARFGITIASPEALGLELKGTREQIIRLLASVSGKCSPLLQVETWVQPTGDLGTAAAAVSRGNCQPCPVGACIEGTVFDTSGAEMPGAKVNLTAAGNPNAATTVTDEHGRFFLAGVADGPAEMLIEVPGFNLLGLESFPVKRGMTHVFDQPLELQVGVVSQVNWTRRLPRPCRPTRKP